MKRARRISPSAGTHSARVVISSSVQLPNLPAKSCMPMMAKTMWKTPTTAITSTTEGSVLMREPMMSFIPGLRWSSRSGLSTRRIRSDLS